MCFNKTNCLPFPLLLQKHPPAPSPSANTNTLNSSPSDPSYGETVSSSSSSAAASIPLPPTSSSIQPINPINSSTANHLQPTNSSSSSTAAPPAPPTSSASSSSPSIRLPDSSKRDVLIGSIPPPSSYPYSSSYGQTYDPYGTAVGTRREGSTWDDSDAAIDGTVTQIAGKGGSKNGKSNLSEMFSPPTYSIPGTFDDAKSSAVASRMWLLVNVQSENDFASHALNRDLWKDEMTIATIMSMFKFWQVSNSNPQGAVYVQRYKVTSFPHVSIIDPRTGRCCWSKEGWSMMNPLTPEVFLQIAIDFCDRNSYDRPPVAPKLLKERGCKDGGGGAASNKRKTMLEGSNNDDNDVIDLTKSSSSSLVETNETTTTKAMALSNEINDDAKVSQPSATSATGNGDDEINNETTTSSSSSSSAMPSLQPSSSPSAISPGSSGWSLPFHVVNPPPGSSVPPCDLCRVKLRMPGGAVVLRVFLKTTKTLELYNFVKSQLKEDGREFAVRGGWPSKVVGIEGTVGDWGLDGGIFTVGYVG